MVRKLLISLWFLRHRTGLSAGVPSVALDGSGEGFSFSTRNKKEFFISVLTSRRSEVDIVLQADEIVRTGTPVLRQDPGWQFLFSLGRAHWIKPAAGYDRSFKEFIGMAVRTLNRTELREADLPRRIQNLITAYHFFSDIMDVRSPLWRDLMRMIFFFSDYLYRFGETRAENDDNFMRALAHLSAGLLFKYTRTGKKWISRALIHLSRYISGRRDAVSVEYIEPSTMISLLLHRHRIRINQPFADMLHDAYIQCAEDYSNAPLEKPVFFLSSTPGDEKYSDLLPAGAVLFGDSSLKEAQPSFTEKALWLVGMEGYERFQSL